MSRKSRRSVSFLVSAFAAFALSACDSASDANYEQAALTAVKSYISTNLAALVTSSTALCAAAPAPDADGWNATADPVAVASMKAEWKKIRVAYEHVEGAIAVLFPDLDASTDERYEGFIETDKDDNLFDDQIVTGVHGIERILYSDVQPARVKTFEEGLPNYKAAAFPSNMTEASDFKTKLCKRLVDDNTTMRDQFAPLALDAATAYRGVIGSINEQVEKATLAATGEEESRYAQFTLADMRANIEAGVQTYAAFKAWVLSKPEGAAVDAEIMAGFKKFQDQYASISGDALPAPPATWSSTNPSAADLMTPFGQLFALIDEQSDPDIEGSLVHAMNHSADLIGIAQLPD